MPRFLTGDELGYIKSVNCSRDPQSSTGWKLEEQILSTPPALAQINSGELEPEKAKESAVQRLSILTESEKTLLAAARSNGPLSTFSLTTDANKLDVLQEWKDDRFKTSHSFIGLDLSPRGLFWCTSNGALGLASKSTVTDTALSLSPTFQKASLPMRLCAWRLSPDGTTFAYGGDEVDLSVWDTERAFQSDVSVSSESHSNNGSKKRKRGGDLFSAEIWRAKNLPNDSLSLRQPIYITSLSYLTSPTNSDGVFLVSGTESGDVRRYDTRAARRPVANWIGIAKVGGVSVVKAGLSEHELLVADNGSNLSALDLRNGRTIYSYKKLQGAITSLAPSSSSGLLGSTSRDRFFRLHTTFPPPKTSGSQQEERGEVVGTLYMKSIPTAVVADTSIESFKDSSEEERADGTDEDDDVWAEMTNVDENRGHTKSKRQT